MDLRDLKTFLHLAESRHFGRSARAMHVSPSTLSRQIQRLEEDLGQPLFVRDNRTVTLTEAGEELRVFAQQTLLQYQQLRHTIDQQGPSLSGELHIFCSVTAAYSHLPPILDRFRHTGVIVRFIEYMDAGTANGWRMDDVVPSAELVERINAVWPIEPIDPNYTGETATRWRYKDGAGEIGFISSVTQAFCKDCSRVRLSIEGSLVLCLFADRGYDLRTLLRGGATDDEIADAIARIWSARDDHYSEIRLSETQKRSRSRIEMQFIGG